MVMLSSVIFEKKSVRKQLNWTLMCVICDKVTFIGVRNI